MGAACMRPFSADDVVILAILVVVLVTYWATERRLCRQLQDREESRR